LVTPALKRGLKPSGLLVAGTSSEGEIGSSTLSSSTGALAAAGFVTPALKRGVKPAGLLAATAGTSSEREADVSTLSSSKNCYCRTF